MLWVELVKILKDINYTFFRPTPFCIDGHRKKMDEELTNKRWTCGMPRITHKKVTPAKEILECLAFKRAYEIVYKCLCSNPLKKIDLTISDFLDLVAEEAAEIETGYKEKYPKINSRTDVSAILMGRDFNFSVAKKPEPSIASAFP